MLHEIGILVGLLAVEFLGLKQNYPDFLAGIQMGTCVLWVILLKWRENRQPMPRIRTFDQSWHLANHDLKGIDSSSHLVPESRI